MSRAGTYGLRLARGFACLALLSGAARAHDGPPYPILVDEVLSGWTVSIWADPDVGTGTFYYYLVPPESGAAPERVRIDAQAQPADGSSPPVSSTSVESEPGQPFQQVGTLEFDQRGTWPTRFCLRSAGTPARVLGELTYDLEVTPPGLGPINLVWFATPFLLIGALWIRGLLAQRAHDRSTPAAKTHP